MFPAPGKICEIRCVNSVAELPPKSLTVPGMKSPPSCHKHTPPSECVEKKGWKGYWCPLVLGLVKTTGLG